MTNNNRIHFIVFHQSEIDHKRIIDLDATIGHAGNLISGNLLSLLMDFTSGLRTEGYYFELWKEGDD